MWAAGDEFDQQINKFREKEVFNVNYMLATYIKYENVFLSRVIILKMNPFKLDYMFSMSQFSFIKPIVKIVLCYEFFLLNMIDLT